MPINTHTFKKPFILNNQNVNKKKKKITRK